MVYWIAEKKLLNLPSIESFGILSVCNKIKTKTNVVSLWKGSRAYFVYYIKMKKNKQIRSHLFV